MIATSFAIADARSGLVSTTSSLITTVSGGAVAEILEASDSGVVFNFNFSITGLKVSGAFIICMYDFTRSWEKFDPVASNPKSIAEAGVDINKSALERYSGVVVLLI